jgi:hypothetical protein
MRGRTGENQAYVRQQKAAEEQLRFEKTEQPSRLASKITAAVYHSAHPAALPITRIFIDDDT